MRLLSNDLRIDHADIWTFRGALDKFAETIPTYDRVVIHPHLEHGYYDFSSVQKLSRIPSIKFDAYHPDICFVNVRGQLLNGPIGAYQSMIVLAAFQAGMSPERTRTLFRRDIFERSGFFSRWEGERKQLLESFAAHGLDMSGPFRAWSRRESFMYGIDLSKARPIHDIAQAFLQQCGIETNRTDIIPADVMMIGSCFPVYPEVAEVLGVEGSYMFKPHREYKLLSLEKFIGESFAIYAKYSLEEISLDSRFAQRFDLVRSVIAEERLQ
jgi:hypothetical protein